MERRGRGEGGRGFLEPYLQEVSAFGGGEEVFNVDDQGGAGVHVDGIRVVGAGVVWCW